ncbi:MAG: hypothetical protein KJO36_08330, partial [Acidimicrobiia bacterium]|nr:hypothetical protein [Acidimicrobiia bacterium]
IDSAGIRADQIYTGTLTALLYRTASSGSRVEISPITPDQIKFFGSANTEVGSIGVQGSSSGQMVFEATNPVISEVHDLDGGVNYNLGTGGLTGQWQLNVNSVLKFFVDYSGSNPISLYVDGALEQVTAGATDSGGSGYRVLRVPN